jgi:N,N'-diacetyllegionaminate synthase
MSITIIAEAAQGYEGDVTLARLLVRAAAAGHADYVKFQMVYADELATPAYRYFDLFRQLEMTEAHWAAVVQQAADSGMRVCFDVFGPRSLDLAIRLGVPAVKIHATDFFHESLLRAAAASMPQVFLSAGGIEADELRQFAERHRDALDRFTLMYGFQAEPTAVADNNLRRLAALARLVPGLRLGFMDHAAGDSDDAGWLGALAVPYGVVAIEKHITLEPKIVLEDSVSALDAGAFAAYVGRVRVAEQALGREDLTLSDPERAYRRRAVKTVVSTQALEQGRTLQTSDVQLLRAPLDDGSEPYYRLAEVVGRTLRRGVEPGRPIYDGDLT